MKQLFPPPVTSGKSLLSRMEDALLPLINLVFLLLMFFIVAGQLANDPLPELPGSQASDQQQPPRADLVITARGDLKVSSTPVTEEELARHLPDPDKEQPLRVAAADSLTMQELERLFRVLEELGYTDILLLTEPAQ